MYFINQHFIQDFIEQLYYWHKDNKLIWKQIFCVTKHSLWLCLLWYADSWQWFVSWSQSSVPACQCHLHTCLHPHLRCCVPAPAENIYLGFTIFSPVTPSWRFIQIQTLKRTGTYSLVQLSRSQLILKFLRFECPFGLMCKTRHALELRTYYLCFTK